MLLGESLIEDGLKLGFLGFLAFFAPASGMPLLLVAPLIGAIFGTAGNQTLRLLRDRASDPDL